MKLLIDTEWASFIEDLPVEKQLEFFWAVFDFGNRPCSLKCWSKIEQTSPFETVRRFGHRIGHRIGYRYGHRTGEYL